MTESLTDEVAPDETAPDPVARDHEAVEAYLNSYDWQEQLRIARVKREKVLADRARLAGDAGLAGDTGVQGASPAKPKRPFVGSLQQKRVAIAIAAKAADQPTPAVVAVPMPDAVAVPVATLASPRQRVLLGLGVGMAAGLLIGLVLPQATKMLGSEASTQLMASGPPAVSPLPSGPAQTKSPSAGNVVFSAPPIIADAKSVKATSTNAPALAEAYGHDVPAVAAPDTGMLATVWTGSPTILGPSRANDAAPAKIAAMATDGPATGLGSLTSAPLTVGPKQADAPIVAQNLPERISVFATAPILPPLPADGDVAVVAANVLSDAQAQPLPNLPNARPAELTLPANTDAVPTISNGVYIPDAGSYRLNLHLAQGNSGARVRGQLSDLGLVNARITTSKFAMADTMVAYYQTDDAEVAQMLATLYGGQTMDMTGFTPAPAARTLDIYLKD